MRMLEIFSSEKTYRPVIPDALCVTSLLEQILHYMVQKGNINVPALFSSASMGQYGRSNVYLAVFIYNWWGVGHRTYTLTQHDSFTKHDWNYSAAHYLYETTLEWSKAKLKLLTWSSLSLSFSPGYYKSLYVLVNHKLPSSLEYSDSPSVPLASTLLEHILKPLHFTYTSCTTGAR